MMGPAPVRRGERGCGAGLAGSAHFAACGTRGRKVRKAFAWIRESGSRYGIEALILGLLALTVAAVAFQDRLLTRTIAFTPRSHPTPAVYSDRDMGGTTAVALAR